MTATAAEPSLRAGTLWAGCVAVGIAQIGIVLPAVVNGPIQAGLHASGTEISWIGDAFLLPIAVLGLTFGVLGDLHGRKKVLVGGGLLMAVGYLVAAAASTVPLLIAGHAVAGIGAAALFQSSLAVVTATTPEPRQRARGLAAWAVAISVGALIAPLLAGVLTEATSFHWVFGACAVIALCSAGLSAVSVTDSSAPQGRAPDWPGQAALALAVLALLYGVIQGPIDGWESLPVLLAFVVGIIAFTAFVRIEARSKTPLLRLELFGVPAFATAAVVAVLGMFAFIGGGYVLSIRLGVIQHETAMGIAWPFVLLQTVPLLLGPVLARLLRGVGPRRLLVTGLLALAAGQLWLAAVPVSATGLVPILGVLALNGIGFVLLVSGLTAAMVNAVPVELAGMASGAASVVRDLGQTLGPAVIGTVALSQAAPVLAQGLAGQPAAQAVLAGGGPMAVAGARLGPRIDEIAAEALAHGYSVGLVVTASTAVVASLVAALFLRER
ncbi:MFS transporter [Kutzneria sp. CA-103260]|uniref:MFS transporter n=1 Tax=Kutzneria sp. CA-103260 TaxID=2802641 RepID=UPI001BAD4827|nr:MFS transporter [Kutzneria sp. CA-103260]QUQ64134.1 major facilitator superfamily transporter [Kutzneria sp. CA-103260]